MNYAVSVIMPAFNSENTIINAVKSVLNQKFQNFELIIVDDGSTDSTLKIISNFSHPYKNIKIMHNKGLKGPSGARNTGIRCSSGKYVSFLDSDDLWLPNHLQEGIAFLEANSNIDVVFFNFEIIEYETKKVIGDWFSSRSVLSSVGSIDIGGQYRMITGNLFSGLIEESFMHLQASIFKKKQDYILFDEEIKRSEDRDYFIRLFKDLNYKFAYKNLVTNIYYRYGNSLTNDSVNNLLLTLSDHIVLFQKYFKIYSLDRSEAKLLSRKIYHAKLELSYCHRKMNNNYLAICSLIQGIKYHIDYKAIVEFLKIVSKILRLN